MKKLDFDKPYQFIDPEKTLNPKEYGPDDLHVFSKFIENIKFFAIGNYCWYIADDKEAKVYAASDNIGSFTPLSREEWLASSGNFFIDLIHPEDQPHMLTAFGYAASIFLNSDETRRKEMTFNFYGRMLNEKNEFRWIMLTAPHNLINSHNEIEMTFIVIYDLSHLKVTNMPLLSVIDFNNQETQYFKHIDQQITKIDVQLPHITKREKEVLQLMAEGYNTPKIAEILFISYNTVENHKSNLRRKTETKTSAELVAYSIKYNLLVI